MEGPGRGGERRKSSIRSSLAGSQERSHESALERSAVAVLVIRVDGTKGPVVHRAVPDLASSSLVAGGRAPNPFVDDMIKEASGRLLECIPENNWSCREEWVSLLRKSAGGATASGGGHQQLSPERPAPNAAAAGDAGSADIFYLAPRVVNVSDCCFFILYRSDLPPPPATVVPGVVSTAKTTGGAARLLRSRCIYGMCRRAPPHLPFAVVLLSAVPCFGILRHQFMSVTSAFFDKACDDAAASDFQAFLLSISHPTTGVIHREAQVQSFGDLPVMWLVSRMGIEHVLGLVKLILLEGRVLLFSSKASKASCAVLALLSLIPGLYNQGLGYEDTTTSQVHGYRWKKFGMPLKVFQESHYVLQPLLVMAQAEALFQRYPGFVVGTSNAMISKLHAAKLDAVVDLDQCQIDSQRFGEPSAIEQIDLARVAFEFGPADATFVEEVIDTLPTRNSPLESESDLLQASSSWDGSDSWIRKHFQSYFEKLLSDASQALHTTRGSQVSSWVPKAVSGLLTPGGRSFESKLADYNKAWVQQWMATRNFAAWQDLYPHPCLQEELDKSHRTDDFRVPVNDGFANVHYPNGDTYQGDLAGGKRHGRGTYLEHATGNTYEGEWKADLRHGKGILITGASDFLYDGDWWEDKRTGRGHCTIRGRETYTGEWLENKFHGQGKFCDADGNVYEGEWVSGRREGAGTLRRVDGEVYVGEWKGGSRSGMGQCNYADGSAYAGMWQDGKRHGEGTHILASGEKFEGMWVEDVKQGWGVLTCGNGDVKEGEWHLDQPKDGEWKITYSSGDQFVGQCKEGRPHGYGVCKFANTDVYTGLWEDGLRSGRGVCIYASGEKFDGLWSCNQPLENDYLLQATYNVPLHDDGDGSAAGGQGGAGRQQGSSSSAPPAAGREQGGPVEATIQRLDSKGEESSVMTSLTPAQLAGLTTGRASIVYPSGDKYEGQLAEGRRHGRGTYHERATGNRYEGEWRDDMRHGRGILTSGSNDFLYDGEWLADKRTGNGHCTIRGRESYTGQWLNNQFHGKGKYVDSDGNMYEGEWVNGAREGAGTYTRTDGEVYIGEWKGGLRSGMGQCTLPDGSVYSGEWRAGKMTGEGTLVSASADKHEGLWSEGKRNGWGVWTSPTGDVVEGEWYADEPKDGEWKITYSNGDQFIGRCKDGRPNGYGVCKYANGAVYTGEWEEGERSGQGVCVFANGEVYDGLWEKDHVSLRGMGTLKFQDGRVHEFS